MKKRGTLLPFFLIFLLLVLPLLLAEDNQTATDSLNTENAKIDKAYECLTNHIESRGCSNLNSIERIFSLLAIPGKCKTEVLSDSNAGLCWPKSSCNLKTTAQAILALERSGVSTLKAENWLISQNTTPQDIEWFIQIETPDGASTCTIKYDDLEYTIDINEDKKLSNAAGSCLTLSSGNYWLKVSPDCYLKEFDISCTESFFTSTLFKKIGSPIIHISEDINPESAEGHTFEKINSACFGSNKVCDYEGSLWAALILKSLDYDVKAYLPYLIAMSEENPETLPEAFLYPLTNEFNSELLAKQKQGYWDASGDKFYDTALAMYALQYDSVSQKEDAKEWLLNVQDKEGCWAGIRNTAFILYSIWRKGSQSQGGEVFLDCEDSGYYCMSPVDCQGEILSNYDCAAPFKCCDEAKPIKTCLEEGGKICDYDETCTGSEVKASDLSVDQSCCLGGSCREQQKISECEEQDGICRAYGCEDNENEVGYDCADASDFCCIEKTETEEKGGYLLIIILIVLIILAVLGIVFRDRLRPYWFKLQSKFKKGPSKPSRPGIAQRRMPLPRRPGFNTRPIPRKIIPNSQQRLPGKKHSLPAKKPKGELDDVLKKLRDMGK